MRRRLHRLLWNLVDKLDDGIYTLRALIDCLEPPFVPIPLSVPDYTTLSAYCPTCSRTICVPALRDSSQQFHDSVITHVLRLHQQAEHAR